MISDAALHHPYVLPEEVARHATEGEVHDFGRHMDARLRALATATDRFSQDEVTLALLTLVESYFHLIGRRQMRYDSLLSPALDFLVPQYPDNRRADAATIESLEVVGPWLRPCEDYHALVDGVINFLKKRMAAVLTRGDRLVFYPQSSFDQELRNRWFELRWHDSRESAGRGILEDNDETRALIARLDRLVAAQLENLRQGIYNPPRTAWYTEHTDGIADRALAGQFSHVAETESWAGLSKEQTIKAVRPLYIRAARRLFGHQRAYKYLRDVEHAQAPVLLSCIETVSLKDLAAEVAASAGIASGTAEVVVESMVRRGREEKFGIQPYPLVPLSGDRASFLPSSVLLAAWPSAREKALAKKPKGAASIGESRNTRYTQVAEDAVRGAGFVHVASELDIHDVATGKTLTDLDVVAVDAGLSTVLVLQLKSFLTPSNLLDIDRADGYVAEAKDQCATADANRLSVQTTIEKHLGISLSASWRLRQIVVVEAIAGTAPPSPLYPVVSIEWLTSQLATPGVTIDSLWNAALTLPDAADFIAGVATAFEVFDDAVRDLKLGRTAAVFAYATGGSVP